MGATADHGDEGRLADIERELTASDPRLAAALRTMTPLWRPAWPWMALAVIAVVLLPFGWLLGSSAVVLLGVGCSLVGAVLVKRRARWSTSWQEESVLRTDGAVVVGIDGTAPSVRAAIWAARETAAFDRPLVLVHGMRWPVYTQAHLDLQVDAGGEESMRRWAQDMLDMIAERCRAVGAVEVRTEITSGDPADAVLLGADEAAFVVVGHADRSAVARLLLGSTAVRLTRSCSVPVVVVRDEAVILENGAGGLVVVGVDGSPVSGVVVRFAFDFASRHGAEIRIVHAADHVDPGVEVVETNTVAELRQGGGVVGAGLADCARRYPDVRSTVYTTTGSPAEVLLAAAAGARLLVVGSHGKGPVSRALLGSVSHTVVNHAPCPVAVLPPETTRS
ncbi:universal stress protein [Saccharothrix deserti]|uniref:universal stress protein n=1 Tax=Saccharothrix deserti TaxID=2593674 RepID=UPI00131A9F45|nr:universal stress protein [Saccharothrix deserti]